MSVLSPIEQVRSWPVSDRLEFLFQIWDELLDTGWAPGLPAEFKKELDARLAEYLNNPSDVRTWDEIEARLKGKP